jgi:hypothetical protein
MCPLAAGMMARRMFNVLNRAGTPAAICTILLSNSGGTSGPGLNPDSFLISSMSTVSAARRDSTPEE